MPPVRSLAAALTAIAVAGCSSVEVVRETVTQACLDEVPALECPEAPAVSDEAKARGFELSAERDDRLTGAGAALAECRSALRTALDILRTCVEVED